MKVYFFGWPGDLGGASTKLSHLLPLLRREYDLMVIPDSDAWLNDHAGRRRLESLGIQYGLFEELPGRLEGWGVALCNFEFLNSRMLTEARRRGLRIAWSSEVMWTAPAELGGLVLGLFDAVLYVSEAQRRVLEPVYRRTLGGRREEDGSPAGDREGWIHAGGRRLRWVMNGNYVDPSLFPFRDRSLERRPDRRLVVGRLSRPDPLKFPDRFPDFYESLGLDRFRFRVMGWSDEVAARWPGREFGEPWELLPALAEDPARFLQSLDLFIYNLSPAFQESWGRVVVEAMLTGAVPMVPRGGEHHLECLVPHGKAGFVCSSDEEFRQCARQLAGNAVLRNEMSHEARRWAVREHCQPDRHLNDWRRLFYGGAIPC